MATPIYYCKPGSVRPSFGVGDGKGDMQERGQAHFMKPTQFRRPGDMHSEGISSLNALRWIMVHLNIPPLVWNFILKNINGRY